MLVALGAELSHGNGSRIRIYLNGRRAVFHRPHPRKETDKGGVASMKRFFDSGRKGTMLKHKGYIGYVEFDEESEIFHGEVINTRDMITFQGSTVKGLKTLLRIQLRII